MKILRFNENLLKGKGENDLPSGVKLQYELKALIDSFGIKNEQFETKNGITRFKISHIHKLNIHIAYYDLDIMKNYYTEEAMAEYDGGWVIFYRNFYNDISKRIIPKENTIESITIEILNICFPNIEDTISKLDITVKEIEQSLNSNKNFLDGLKKAKKYKDEN